MFFKKMVVTQIGHIVASDQHNLAGVFAHINQRIACLDEFVQVAQVTDENHYK
jgi:hypothetical protein